MMLRITSTFMPLALQPAPLTAPAKHLLRILSLNAPLVALAVIDPTDFASSDTVATWLE
jgi:hypothetical protein